MYVYMYMISIIYVYNVYRHIVYVYSTYIIYNAYVCIHNAYVYIYVYIYIYWDMLGFTVQGTWEGTPMSPDPLGVSCPEEMSS